MLDARTNLGIQVIEEVKKYFQDKVYKTIIPRNVRLSEAPSHGEPIIIYDSKSRGAEVYLDLAKEVVQMAKGLGKGIKCFFKRKPVRKRQSRKSALKKLRPNPYQPRKTFQQEAIDELKLSIIRTWNPQPSLLRKSIKGYEIVVGERRFRAAKEAKLETVPAVVRDLTEQQMMELAVLENLQREDLNPIEEGVPTKH